MANYDPKSLRAEEFINHEEILATLAYAQEHKNDAALIDAILEKARPKPTSGGVHCEGLTHREAAVLLATAPKSNASYVAINTAMADIRKGRGQGFPRCLQNVHYDSAEVEQKGQHYLYPHDYPNHWVEQQYLPDELTDSVFYEPSTMGYESKVQEHMKWLKEEK